MRPTFLTDFAARVDDLVRSVGVQQDSRGARHEAQAEIESALARGSRLIGQLDVTVANALSDDPGRLGRWHGARRMDHPSSSGPAEEPGPEVVAPEPAASVTPVIAEATPAVRPPEEVLKIAS
jgi:hypothetical protein